MRAATVARLSVLATLISGAVVPHIPTQKAPAALDVSFAGAPYYPNLDISAIERRVPASPPKINVHLDLWGRSICKGEKLYNGMLSSDAEAAKVFDSTQESIQSPFKDFPGDLVKWGWHDVHWEDILKYAFELQWTWGIDHVLRDLGVSDKSLQDDGKNEIVQVQHFLPVDDPDLINGQSYRVGKKTYRATGASLMFSMNPTDGVIMTMNRKSPKSAAKERQPKVPDDQIPDLNQWSDAAWLYYRHRVDQEKVPRRVKYFLTLNVVNLDTKWVVGMALFLVGQEIKPWPGYTFYPDSEGFKAILGTPNAQGFAFFLLQHKDWEQLGNKYISEITAFHCEAKLKEFCILFKVAPVPPSNPKPSFVKRVPASEIGTRIAEEEHITTRHTLRAQFSTSVSATEIDTITRKSAFPADLTERDEETWSNWKVRGIGPKAALDAKRSHRIRPKVKTER